jgi:hypothetical protein
MITRIVAIGSLAALLAAASTATADDTFRARLSREQEVPPVTDQGTTGKFEIQFNRDFTEGDYSLVLAPPGSRRSARRRGRPWLMIGGQSAWTQQPSLTAERR